MTDLATLDQDALVTLSDCEQRIERGLSTYIDVGEALGEIRESRLYRATHETFEAYCRERWGFTDRRARQLMEAAEIGNMFPVENSRQAAALAAVPEADRADVLAAATEQTNGKPTAAAIRDAAKARTPTPAPAECPPDAPSPQEPDPTPTREVILAAVLEELDGHGPLGRSVTEIWAKMPPRTVSAAVQAAVEELVRRGRVVAGPVVRGTARWLLTPEPANVAPAADSDPGEAGVSTRGGDAPASPEPSASVRIEPTASERQLAEQRDARGLLLRAVEILAPAHDRPGYAETWARQLGPYDAELSDLVRRAAEAITTLDDLIEGCGQ